MFSVNFVGVCLCGAGMQGKQRDRERQTQRQNEYKIEGGVGSAKALVPNLKERGFSHLSQSLHYFMHNWHSGSKDS